MNQKTFIITAQIFISGIMAFLMTLFFSVLKLGFNSHMVYQWLTSFIVGWPVAFLCSLVVSPVAFFITGKIYKVNSQQVLDN